MRIFKDEYTKKHLNSASDIAFQELTKNGLHQAAYFVKREMEFRKNVKLFFFGLLNE